MSSRGPASTSRVGREHCDCLSQDHYIDHSTKIQNRIDLLSYIITLHYIYHSTNFQTRLSGESGGGRGEATLAFFPPEVEQEPEGGKCIFRRFVLTGLFSVSLGSELVKPFTCKSSATARNAASLSCPMLTSPWYMKSSIEASSSLGTPLR